MTYGWKAVTKDFLVDSNYGDFEISGLSSSFVVSNSAAFELAGNLNIKNYAQVKYCNECYIEKNHKLSLTNMYWDIKGEYKHMIVSIKQNELATLERKK